MKQFQLINIINYLKKWSDYNFKWNPLDYGNIEKIRVPAEDIWIPGILNII